MGTRASEGCIRLRNEDIQKLRTLAKVGMRVIIQGSRKDAEADGVEYVTPKAAHLYATRTTPAATPTYAGPATSGG